MRLSFGVVLAIFTEVASSQTPAVTDYDSHKQLEWKASGGCVVSFVKTPCRTVRFREYSFGSSLGFRGITNTESVHAVDQEGSESTSITATTRRFWLLSERTVNYTELLLRGRNRIVRIDHDGRVFAEEGGGANRGYQIWEKDDSKCSHAKSHYLYLSERLPDSTVAGLHVVGYGGRDDRGAEYDVYFAPSLGCEVMRFAMVMRGFLGWTTAKYEREVVTYEIGPPSGSLFAIPSSYKQVNLSDMTEAMTANRWLPW